ncbi:MAG: hypothetical protein PSW75_03735 [bacterium]|nr:hypothetical protein [bacterium]MDI1335251.1 hypothetical protein [Lacunisphaera sp.]
MNSFDRQWQKLTALARSAPVEPGAAPHGFATRVAAQAAAAPALGPWAAFEHFALRGLVVAAAFGVAAIAFNYSSLMSDQSDDYASADTVGELLDLS